MPWFKLRALFLTAALSVVSAGASAQVYSRQSVSAQLDGPVFSAEQIEHGITMSAAQCGAYRSTVFVPVQGVGLCFRYYLSTAGGTSDQAVYFLDADKDPGGYAFDPAMFDGFATSWSNSYHMPVVILARMGIEGSSGWHRYRRTWFEVEATHRAIDAINARHGFQKIHVMGQSGGGHLTGALVGTREDIGCAVPGSGRLAFDTSYIAQMAKQAPQFRHYNPHDNLAAVIRHSATARILVVTDPRDQRVPVRMQTPFVRDVQMAGGRISQVFVTASEPEHHGVIPYTWQVMGACLRGDSDAEIAKMVANISAKLSAEHVAKQRQQAGG